MPDVLKIVLGNGKTILAWVTLGGSANSTRKFNLTGNTITQLKTCSVIPTVYRQYCIRIFLCRLEFGLKIFYRLKGCA